MKHQIESYVDELLTVAENINRPPTQTEYNQQKSQDAPSAKSIRDKIGSWEGALVVAGLNPNSIEQDEIQTDRPAYNLEDIIEAIQYVAEQVQDHPTVTDYKENRRPDDPTIATIYNRFDEKDNVWTFACETAGLTENDKKYQEYTEEDCLTAIKRVVGELERNPTQSDYKILSNKDDPSLSTIKSRFNGWIPALEQAKNDKNT